MHAKTILTRFLTEQTPTMHSVRREALAATISSALDGSTLTVTSLGRSLDGGEVYEKHRIKRVDRLLSNRHLYAERVGLYRGAARRVLSGTTRPVISVDWSHLDRKMTRYLLRASVALDGRAFTVYEEVHPRERCMKPKVERAFVQRLAEIVEPHRRAVIVTDAGFHNPWRRQVLALGWDHIGRVRGRVMLASSQQDDWQQARHVFSQAKTKPMRLSKGRVSRDKPLDCHFVLVKQCRRGRHDANRFGKRAKAHVSNEKARSQREPWLLATSIDLSNPAAIKRVVKAYKTRMQIEEAFRDVKSERFGLGLAASRAKVTERIEVLLLIAMLAIYLAWLIGLCVRAANHQYRYQANTETKRRTLSIVFLGRRAWKNRHFTATAAELNLAIQAIRTAIQQHAQGL